MTEAEILLAGLWLSLLLLATVNYSYSLKSKSAWQFFWFMLVMLDALMLAYQFTGLVRI